MARFSTIILSIILLSGCFLNKQERLDRRANRKLDRLTAKYPQLVQQDTLIDTVEVIVPEVRIDTVFNLSEDVTGVDTIFMRFNDRLDSITSRELTQQIKYYVTNRQVIDDTIVHTEDGVTVKIWQEGNTVRYQVDKPTERVLQEVRTPYRRVRKVETGMKWSKRSIACGIIITCLILFLLKRIN